MRYFLSGLGFGLLGLVIWAVASIFAGTAEALKQTQPWFGRPLMIVGFTMMFLAPLTFWIIVPIIKLTRRHWK